MTDVAPLGGASMKTKWGTPDVIGVYKPLAGNLIKFPKEIVSAEIKIDLQASVVAFGQAVAYRLFSTKTYVVMPTTLTEEDQSRLESLCMLFGIGLVLFDVDKDNPKFSIRVRAQRFSPEIYSTSTNSRIASSCMTPKCSNICSDDSEIFRHVRAQLAAHFTKSAREGLLNRQGGQQGLHVLLIAG